MDGARSNFSKKNIMDYCLPLQMNTFGPKKSTFHVWVKKHNFYNIYRWRAMLMSEESESTKDIRRAVCCQLAEALMHSNRYVVFRIFRQITTLMSLVSHMKSNLVCTELSNLRILCNIYLFSSSCLCSVGCLSFVR